jgi:hypothetical protein
MPKIARKVGGYMRARILQNLRCAVRERTYAKN